MPKFMQIKYGGPYEETQKEAWACKGCGAIDEDHDWDGSPNLDRCGCEFDNAHKKVVTDVYRKNYDLIRWDEKVNTKGF